MRRQRLGQASGDEVGGRVDAKNVAAHHKSVEGPQSLHLVAYGPLAILFAGQVRDPQAQVGHGHGRMVHIVGTASLRAAQSIGRGELQPLADIDAIRRNGVNRKIQFTPYIFYEIFKKLIHSRKAA